MANKANEDGQTRRTLFRRLFECYIAGKVVTIYFYTKLDEYGDFSNFFKHGVEMDGV